MVEKITAEQVADVVTFTIPKFAEYNPRQDVKSSSWFRLDHNWYVAVLKKGCRWSLAGFWPVFVGCVSESKKSVAHFDTLFLARTLGVKSTMIKKALAEFHNLELLELDEQSVTRTCPTNERTNERDERLEFQTRARTDAPPLKAAPSVRPKGPNPSLLVDVWNENRGPLPAVEKLTKGRAAKIKSRLKEEPDPAYWESVVRRAAETPFLRGENDRGWKANFDWLVRNDENHAKVMEGGYGEASEPELDEEAKIDRRLKMLAEENAWNR